MAKKLTPKKAQEILRDGTVHGKPLTGKQKRFFGWMSQKHYHMKPYLEDGGAIVPDGITAQAGSTVYVSDPKDPRLKAYQDSLFLFNNSKAVQDYYKKQGYKQENSWSVPSDYINQANAAMSDLKNRVNKRAKESSTLRLSKGTPVPFLFNNKGQVYYKDDSNIFERMTGEGNEIYGRDVYNKAATNYVNRLVPKDGMTPLLDMYNAGFVDIDAPTQYLHPTIKPHISVGFSGTGAKRGNYDEVFSYDLNKIKPTQPVIYHQKQDIPSKPVKTIKTKTNPPAPKSTNKTPSEPKPLPEKPLTKQKPQAVPYDIPDISIQAGTPTPQRLEQPKTPFSFTYRDENNPARQSTQYFPNLESWKQFTEANPYISRDVSGDNKSAQGVGYRQFQPGGRVPIYTENPNDPQLKSYQDSLNLYNQYSGLVNTIKSGNKYLNNPEVKSPVKITKNGTFKTPNPNNAITLHKVSNDFAYNDIGDKGYKDVDVSLNKKIQPIATEVYTRKESKYKSEGDYDKAVKKLKSASEKPGEANWVGFQVLKYKKPVQPVIYKKPQFLQQDFYEIEPNLKPKAALEKTNLTDNPVINAGMPTGKTLGEYPTNYSVTFRDENSPSKQRTQYFPDLESWKNFTDNAGYMHRDYTADGKSAQAVGYNKFKGGGGVIADDGTGIVYPQDGAVAHAGPGYQGLGYSNSGYNYNSAWGGRFQSGGYIPEAQNGFLSELYSKLNPYNWGVDDYSDKKDFSKAYSSAKKAGEEEFMYNGKRYNTTYGGTPRQEVGAYGVNGRPVKEEFYSDPAMVTLFPKLGKYAPGHIAASISGNDVSIDYSGSGNNPYGISRATNKGEETYYVYGADNTVFNKKAASLPLGIYDFNNPVASSTWNLFTNNCADNTCDGFGIPRSKFLQTPPGAVKKIKEKYPTLNVTGRTPEDYSDFIDNLNKEYNSTSDGKKILANADKLFSIYQSPETKTDEMEKIGYLLQKALIKEGYELPGSYIGGNKYNVDKIVGPETEKALKDWKKQNKISSKEMGGYIPEAQAGIELGVIPTQETYMGRPVGNKLTPPPSGMSVPLTTEAQRYSNRQKSNYAPDTIGPTPAKRSAIAKGLAMAAHPMTTAQYLVKNQDIPDYLEKNPNAYDYATPFVNPASSIYAGFQVPGNLSRGEYTQAGLNTLAVLPGLKSLPKATRAAINAGDRAFSPVGRALNKIEQEGLAAGMSEFDIAKRQLNNVGITSNQREGYIPGLSEFARKYVTPYGYMGNGSGSQSKLMQTLDNIKNKGVNYVQEDVSNARADAWNMYLGFPQKYRTFRLSETAPVNHAAYSPRQLKNMDIYNLNEEKALGRDVMHSAENFNPFSHDNFDLLTKPSAVRHDLTDVMGNYNARFTNEGLQYNDIWDLNPQITPLNYLPSKLRNRLEESRLFNKKIVSPYGTSYHPRAVSLDVGKFLGKPFMSHGNIPEVTKEVFADKFKNTLNRQLDEAKKLMESGIDMTPRIKKVQENIEQFRFINPTYQMGGSIGGGNLPGATGMMYARTGSTYRDKKEAGDMLYYEQGLDWQPRTISKAGSTVPVSSRGLYDHPNQVVDVPTPDGSITMADIDYPVYGVDNTGMEQMMMPGGEYQFDGDMVRETPMMKAGGEMIKRADGSYSRRGFWDNVRDNKGSGKKPTKEMLKQERKIKRSMEEGGVVAQAGTEVTPQAPPQPSKKSQLDLVLESPSKFDNGKTFHDIVKEVATESKVDPKLLWSSSFVEGMNLAALKPNQVSNAYLAEHERSSKILDYPVDGFYNYGLDNFGDTYPELVKRGYLPKDFDYYSYKTTNEQNRPIKTAAFRSNRDAVMAKAAYLKYEADRVKHYAAKQKLELTPDEQAFFTMAAYNGGLGSAQAMLEDLKKSGLAPSAFIKQGKTSKGQVYKNVKPRYDMMFKVANMFKAGGEVKTIQDMGQLKKLDQLTNFTNYNDYE